jgi:hypothetical protein
MTRAMQGIDDMGGGFLVVFDQEDFHRARITRS